MPMSTNPDKKNPFADLDVEFASVEPHEGQTSEAGEQDEDVSVATPNQSQATESTRKQANKEPSQEEVVQRIPIGPNPPAKQEYTKKQTFEFSKDELRFLKQIKLELEEYKVTQNEVVRAGIELLAKDYVANRRESFLVRKFQLRKPVDLELLED